MSQRVYVRLEYPRTCRVCGSSVTLTGADVSSRNARSQARARGYVFCPLPQPCSTIGRAASIRAAKARKRSAA